MKLLTKYFELIFWIASLIWLAIIEPAADHFSLCIFKWLGIHFCPWCGLGHSISYLFHGNIAASFSSHPLGIFAVAVIIFRIYKLLKHHLLSKKINHYAIR